MSGIGQHIVGASWLRGALPWASWCILFVPVSIVLHELGHFTAAAWLGFPDPALHFSSISHGDITNRPAADGGLVGLTGPFVTVMLVLFACAWIQFRSPARWAFALCVAAASRFVVGVPYTAVNSAMLLMGKRLHPPAFDEHKAGSALGWSGDALLAFTAILLISVLAWIGFKLPRGQRSAAWCGLMFGTVIGWALWMKVLGPAVLP